MQWSSGRRIRGGRRPFGGTHFGVVRLVRTQLVLTASFHGSGSWGQHADEISARHAVLALIKFFQRTASGSKQVADHHRSQLVADGVWRDR